MKESKVLADVLQYLGNRSDAKIWRHNTGRIADRNGRVVSFGLVGSADVIGMRRVVVKQSDIELLRALSGKPTVEPFAQFLAVECKSDHGRQSESQRNFQHMVESMGGLYILARRVEDLYPWFPKEM